MDEQNKKITSLFDSAIRRIEKLKVSFCLRHRSPDWLANSLLSTQTACRYLKDGFQIVICIEMMHNKK